jgi:NADPH:quinone reductase-like Zn-dependent oxidoreductase
MKAAVLSAVGGPITIEDIPTPAPKAGEVLVCVVRRGIQLIGSYGSRVRTEMPDVLALAARGQVSAS